MSDTRPTTEVNLLLETEAIPPFSTVYQPIFSLETGKVWGYEALTRDGRVPALSPEALFDEAKAKGALFGLEIAARKEAIASRPTMGDDQKLCINVDPSILMDPAYQEGITLKNLAAAGLSTKSVVLEITERFRIFDPKSLEAVIQHYRLQGFLIALDDFGSGYANLVLLSQLSPDYVKLDRALVHRVAEQPRQQHVIDAMVRFASASATTLIAEGVEQPRDLGWLQENGVPLAQGYLLGRPLPPRALPGSAQLRNAMTFARHL